MRSPLATLWAVQRSARQRRAATVGAVLVGLGLGSVHWLGFVVGGALVGVCWPSLRSAIAAGFGFGVVAVAVFLARFALVGTLDGALGMGPLIAIAVVTPLVAGSLGAAVRGLLPAGESE
ncbi:hypothetical protein EGH21_01560 [Halomicroarcula sp. F13]|uniref:Major facilitator superfamily (MFS) profile domain-containing protein n=1 Tax=Haloarcula rubra TaxID=2487747 RepID=A0AAW4PKZ4_9EURY|nr:hypothetical protein [Halomicroarcula rubra]MBX0321708.1 hypothetical protein [Halomicroarcula rubra]